MTDDWGISVLMPVYDGADAPHLAEALESVFSQTLPPDEVVVVEDGPLREELRRVLERFADREVPLVRVALPENVGIGPALQAGLLAAREPWVARMDADDISVPDRLERQMNVVREGEVDVLGSALVEFEHDPSSQLGIRSRPLSHNEIARHARMNNPVNHPTVVMRRSTVLDVGGYRALQGAEDYDLFARLLARGYRFRNLPEPLYLCRAGDAQLRRRAARGMFAAELELQHNLRSYGLVSRPRSWVNVVLRTTFRALPLGLLRWAYRVLFRRRVHAR